MTRILTKLEGLERQVRLCALAFLLSFQGLVSVGAADALLYPELTAPDGFTLSPGDVCNNTASGHHACKHCCGCLSIPALAADPMVSLSAPTQVEAALYPTATAAPLFRPEAVHSLHCGPPAR